MKVAVVCGSHELYLDEKALAGQFIIGVDRGAFHLLKRGISPDLAIGDFDSVTPEEYDAVSQATRELIHLPCEKDETDTEAALNLALQRGASEVTLYGALGGRIDHTLANIRLLLQFVKKGLYVQLVGEKNRLTVLSKGEHHLEATAFKYLSFFALESTVTHLTLKDVKYPLVNYTLAQDDIRCISNETLGADYQVKFESGYLLMISSCD